MQITKQSNQIKFDRISHAYITDETLVDPLSMAVVCGARDRKRPCLECSHCSKALRGIHPDITVISKPEDKRDILVDQVRELKKDVYILPNEASQKAYVIRSAEAMNPSAQNALLRVLEEPPAHAVFILCTNTPSALLRTVRSRCVMLNLQNAEDYSGYPGQDDGSAEDYSGYPEKDDENEAGLARDFIDALGHDDVALMRCMFQIEKLDRAALSGFLSEVREQIVLLFKENPVYMKTNATVGDRRSQSMLVSAEELLTKAEEMLSLNVNAGHIAGMICAGLTGAGAKSAP